MEQIHCDFINMSNLSDRIFAIRMLRKLLPWVGLWKWKDENGICGAFKRNYGYVLHVPLTFMEITLMWVEALNSEDLDQTAQRLYLCLGQICVVVKICNIWSKRQLAWSFVDELERSAMFDLRSTEERILWQRAQIRFKRVFNAYIWGNTMGLIIPIISVLFQKSYVLPFSFYIPFEWRTPVRYYSLWTYNVAASMLTTYSNLVLDCLGCYFMFHISLLYRLLNLRLSVLKLTPEKEASSELRHIFQFHHRVRILTQQCEQLVSPYVLSQVVFSAFIICFSGYRMIHMGFKKNPEEFLVVLQFLVAMVGQIFLPSYYGNEITIHASELTRSAFSINWLEYSIATRKELFMYMEHIKQPVKVRAGGFFEIGLPMFVKTINNAYSVFALLLKLSK